MLTTNTRQDKIALLKTKAKTNPEAKALLDVTMLYYPKLLDYPTTATPGMVRGYNRLIEGNISDVALKKALQIGE